MRLRRRLILGHLADLYRLALPVVVSRAGVLAMTVADTVIVGRYSAIELGYLSLGVAVYLPLLLTVMGLLTGTTVAAAQAMGRGEEAESGAAWRRAVPVALGFGALGLVLGSFGREMLLLAGQGEDVAAGAGRVFFILALGYPAGFLYFATAFFLEGIRHPRPVAWAIITANLVNIPADLLLVHGLLGLPALGAEGSAWATTGIRWGLAVFLLTYVWWMPGRERFAIRARASWHGRRWRVQRMVGYAAAVAIAVEMGAFTAIHLFAGWLGTVPLAVFTIVLNVISVIFMIANGVGIATGVRIGNAYGRGDRQRWIAAGWMGLAATICLMAAAGALMAACARPLAAIYSSEAAVLAAAIPVLVLAGLLPVFDGGQTLMLNALRGCSDAWVPTALQAFAFIGCMVPLALLLAFELERGVAGLFEAVVLSTAVSLGLLCARFVMLSRRA
ncbi:MAG: MATE family efflux transporter [Alphaproteobacteria bacterium]|nr:MATE family efflux transporter [Alphaproteobacteria bacterium]